MVQNQLSPCIDQGSVGWCPSFYLLFACKLKMVLHFDVFYRTWNDLKAALLMTGLWGIVLLMCLVFSVNYGPFEGAGFWRQAQYACESWKEHHGADCPLFRALLPRIAKDRGTSDKLWDSGCRSCLERYVGIGRDASTKGPKVSLSRWLGWEHCFDYWSKDFSLKLLHLLYMGTSLGHMDHRAETSVLKLQPMKAPASAEASKQGMKEAQATVRPLGDRCKNTLHIVALILGCSTHPAVAYGLHAHVGTNVCNVHEGALDLSSTQFVRTCSGPAPQSVIVCVRVVAHICCCMLWMVPTLAQAIAFDMLLNLLSCVQSCVCPLHLPMCAIWRRWRGCDQEGQADCGDAQGL